LLGLAKDADEAQIKKAYKKQALVWHPDKHSSGTEEEQAHANKMFRDIGEAYTVLSDPQKKQRYDQGADIEEIENGGGMGGHNFHGGGGMDPNDIFAAFFGGGGGGGMPPGFGFPSGGGGRGGAQSFTFRYA
jgi:DnaJ family protein C protein 7